MNRNYLYSIVVVILTGIVMPDIVFAQRHKKAEGEKELSIYDVDTVTNPIPLQRKYIHDKVDKEQKRAAVGFKYIASDDTVAYNNLIHAMINEVDHMQVMIENLPYDDAQTESMQ
jgi:hypothetical protein